MKGSFDYLKANEEASRYLRNGNTDKAFELFSKANCLYGCALCDILNDKLGNAKKILNRISDSSAYADWLLILCSILSDEEIKPPTYFQLRNFYEQDIDMFFLYKKYDYIEKVFRKSDYFALFNMEIYKYNARILLNYGHLEDSKHLLKKSLEIFYKDPETHYLMGEIYLKENKEIKAKESFTKAIEVNHGYYPAMKKLKEKA